MQDITTLIPYIGTGLFHLLVFPGGFFALLVGLFFKGLDRKVEARMQRRAGPPITQPFYDLIKLSTKETLIPHTAQRTLFLAAPLIGFAGMAVCASLLPIPGVYAGMANMGDLLVYFYLLPLPGIAIMIAGSASSSPFGAMGFSREMLLMFAYEIPLLLIIITIALFVGKGTSAEFSLGAIVTSQLADGQHIMDWRLIPAFIAYLMFLPGTMGVAPFDIAEAETELLEGPLLEYSGGALAFFQLTSALKFIVVLGLGVVLFFPGLSGGGLVADLLYFVAKCFILMLFAITLVKASSARFKVEQAFKFYLKYPSILAAISLVLVLLNI